MIGFGRTERDENVALRRRIGTDGSFERKREKSGSVGVREGYDESICKFITLSSRKLKLEREMWLTLRETETLDEVLRDRTELLVLRFHISFALRKKKRQDSLISYHLSQLLPIPLSTSVLHSSSPRYH
jgi:hypothetical protein